MALIHLNFRSWCLNSNTDVAVILPSIKQGTNAQEYYRSGKKYPVLWLLHGTLGCYNDYLRRTNIELYATENDLIVVMPSAQNSNYSNWDKVIPQFNMFDFLTEELMPLIYGWFPASDKREDNFICGLSMGARGSSKYAFNHPDKFAGCACMSGVPSDIRKIMSEGPSNAFYAREKITVEQAGGLEKYLASYENFREYAEQVGLKAVFDVRPGYGHEWRFWEMELQEILKFFGFDRGQVKTEPKPGKRPDGTLV